MYNQWKALLSFFLFFDSILFYSILCFVLYLLEHKLNKLNKFKQIKFHKFMKVLLPNTTNRQMSFQCKRFELPLISLHFSPKKPNFRGQFKVFLGNSSPDILKVFQSFSFWLRLLFHSFFSPVLVSSLFFRSFLCQVT